MTLQCETPGSRNYKMRETVPPQLFLVSPLHWARDLVSVSAQWSSLWVESSVMVVPKGWKYIDRWFILCIYCCDKKFLIKVNQNYVKSFTPYFVLFLSLQDPFLKFVENINFSFFMNEIFFILIYNKNINNLDCNKQIYF